MYGQCVGDEIVEVWGFGAGRRRRGRRVMAVTLEDFEIRYRNIRKNNPKVKKCSVSGCNNPQDSTPKLGMDTCCAYHRLLFDFWSCEVMDIKKFYHYLESQKGRRRAFTNWMNKLGKTKCDRLVLKMAQEGINWEC